MLQLVVQPHIVWPQTAADWKAAAARHAIAMERERETQDDDSDLDEVSDEERDTHDEQIQFLYDTMQL